MNKKLTAWIYSLGILLLMLSCVAFISCGDKEKEDVDDSKDGGINGWYTNLNQVAKQSDFSKINQAINNNEVLSSYKYGGVTHTYVASRNLFISDDGRYSDSNSSFGKLRFSIQNPINVIRIVNDNSLLFYVGWLYEDGASSDDAIYKIYAGSIFGNMTYYGTPTYYTYARIDNKIILSNGDIYTIVDGGLIKDGSSGRWSKYNQNKRY